MDKKDVKTYYIAYLQEKLDSKTISKGSHKLLMLSESAFNDYFYQFSENEVFRNRQIEVYKSWMRDKKLNDLFKSEKK